MSGRLVALALVLASVAAIAAAEEARPGHTLVLHHGSEPGIASAMPGGVLHDARLAFPLPTTAPTSRVTVAMPGARLRGPAIDANGRIYVGTAVGVTVIEPDGGASYDVALDALDALDCAPVIVPGGGALALSRDGHAMLLSGGGAVRARASTGLAIRFSPLVRDDGSLIVVAASRMLAELGSDLTLRRTRELPGGFALSPTETTRGRYAIAAGAELVIVDAATLEIERLIALPGRAATPAARASDGTLWVATVDGDLVRVHAETRIDHTIALGARLPEAATSDHTMLGIAEGGDVVVVVPSRGLVRVAPTGAERWTWASDAPLVSAIAVDASGRTVVADRVGHLSVISAAGEREWTLALAALPFGPAITTAQGRLVIATDQGVVLLGPG